MVDQQPPEAIKLKELNAELNQCKDAFRNTRLWCNDSNKDTTQSQDLIHRLQRSVAALSETLVPALPFLKATAKSWAASPPVDDVLKLLPKLLVELLSLEHIRASPVAKELLDVMMIYANIPGEVGGGLSKRQKWAATICSQVLLPYPVTLIKEFDDMLVANGGPPAFDDGALASVLLQDQAALLENMRTQGGGKDLATRLEAMATELLPQETGLSSLSQIPDSLSPAERIANAYDCARDLQDGMTSKLLQACSHPVTTNEHSRWSRPSAVPSLMCVTTAWERSRNCPVLWAQELWRTICSYLPPSPAFDNEELDDVISVGNVQHANEYVSGLEVWSLVAAPQWEGLVMGALVAAFSTQGCAECNAGNGRSEDTQQLKSLLAWILAPESHQARIDMEKQLGPSLAVLRAALESIRQISTPIQVADTFISTWREIPSDCALRMLGPAVAVAWLVTCPCALSGSSELSAVLQKLIRESVPEGISSEEFLAAFDSALCIMEAVSLQSVHIRQAIPFLTCLSGWTESARNSVDTSDGEAKLMKLKERCRIMLIEKKDI